MSRRTVAGGLLRGCLAAILAVGSIAAPFLLGVAAYNGGLTGPAHALLLVGVAFAITGAVMLPRLLFALPPAALAAYRYNGGVAGALTIGALAGAALELALVVAAFSVSVTLPGADMVGATALMLTQISGGDVMPESAGVIPFVAVALSGNAVAGAFAGAVFAWPVWHRCVRPRRLARQA